MNVRLRSLSLASLALSAVCASSLAEPIKRIQFPAISPDGSTVVFSWQNDLWSVPRAGGNAVRLTVHAAPDTRPVWFPDGSRITLLPRGMAATMYSQCAPMAPTSAGSRSTQAVLNIQHRYPQTVGMSTAQQVFGREAMFFECPRPGGTFTALPATL